LGETECIRRQRRHAPHGFLERQRATVARIVSEDAWKRPEQSRMRFSLEIRYPVGADHHVAVPEIRLDVGFVDDELDADRAVTEWRGEDELHGVRDVDVPLACDVREHAPLELAKRRTTRDADHFCELAARLFEVEVLDHPAAASRVWIDVERHTLSRI